MTYIELLPPRGFDKITRTLSTARPNGAFARLYAIEWLRRDLPNEFRHLASPAGFGLLIEDRDGIARVVFESTNRQSVLDKARDLGVYELTHGDYHAPLPAL